MTHWTEIPGNSQSIDTIYGPAVAEAKDGDVFVELGVFCGRSLAMLCEMVLQSGKLIAVYGVDLWEDGGAITRNASHPYEPAVMDQCIRDVERTVDKGVKLALFREDTASAAYRFEDRSVTLAFIDGDHSYAGVQRDIAAWWPKVKPGGLLAGHDYSHEYPGVMQAVGEAFPGYVHHGERDCGICWYVRKPL
jgi:hypothetical protein